MIKQKVIPAKGQTWVSDSNGEEALIKGFNVSGNLVISEFSLAIPVNEFVDIFTFKPANDLEALAVHPKYHWLKNDCVDGYDGIYKVSEMGHSIDCVNDGEGVLGSIVIAKHNELFGITEELELKINNNIRIYPVNDGIVRANVDKMKEPGAQLVASGVKMNIDDIAKEDGVTLKPVYTQAMHDNLRSPQVGSIVDIEFIFSETFRNVEITYMGNEVGCYKASNGNEFTFSMDAIRFHAVDTLTDEERLIKEVADKIKFIRGKMDIPDNKLMAEYLIKSFNITRKDES